MFDDFVLSETVIKDTNWCGEAVYSFLTPGRVGEIAGYFEVTITLCIYDLVHVQGEQAKYHISGPVFISEWERMLKSGTSFFFAVLVLAALYGLLSFGLSLQSEG